MTLSTLPMQADMWTTPTTVDMPDHSSNKIACEKRGSVGTCREGVVVKTGSIPCESQKAPLEIWDISRENRESLILLKKSLLSWFFLAVLIKLMRIF